MSVSGGPSPRGRGNRDRRCHRLDLGRSIPAWAGKPPPAVGLPRIPRVHPRVGGETQAGEQWSSSQTGPSPRGRGNREHRAKLRLADGSIPAWAGKPPAAQVASTRREVHPRVGGETSAGSGMPSCIKGPSPRGRGNHECTGGRSGAQRSIPAWAGKPRSRCRCPYRQGVHPRVGGETS